MRLSRALAWWWDTLRPDHWRHWPDWLRDWYGLRKRRTHKALAQRLAMQRDRLLAIEGKVEAIFVMMEEVTGTTREELREEKPERHLHLVRLIA